MAYEHEWPYTSISPNRDWLINKVKELESRLDGIVEEAVELSKQYTDEQLANYQSQVEELRRELFAAVDDLENDFDNLQAQVNISIQQIELKIGNLENQIAADIAAVYEHIELAIEQNNQYILSEISKVLADVEVYNILTGENMTIQNMFNYLCNLHLENPITYDELAAKNITYDDLAALNITYTDLAINGKSLIP